ncbi:LAMI_0C02696g1_1 [Lachancea mirantina]|uniref:LAMI_0C02696g1_1 n=1 Tax=Lachancea mirantina TaxID=1230905 RepID=A0A1G4J115_9SACH|nr:LAMI_0C02696g1_1 [Lachancea mirantina]
MLDRTSSFQDCREADVPGYNDCPTFVFQTGKPRTARKLLLTSVVDTYGNTKKADQPPPSIGRNQGNKKHEPMDEMECEANEKNVIQMLDDLLARESRLPAQEFEFYKKKLLKNVDKSLEDRNCASNLVEVLSSVDTDTEGTKRLLSRWMMADASIGNWCSALRKLIENVKQ